MVAIIKTGSSIHRIFNYNEQKVKEGLAQCIAAVNYPKDVEDLSSAHKLYRLLNQAALNENVTRNSVHISLNFDPSENLSRIRLNEVADVYMNKIGFGKQPYLVYQHEDAAHPHIHIVTIKVRENGRRIETQNIGRNQSEKARKEIEQAFGLKRAEESKQRQVYELKPVNVQKVQYGKLETKRAINDVLKVVLNNYKYSSLPELNAVLQQYNVIADRGNPNSRVYQNNGLTFRVIDENGNKVGVPIKASDFYSKPTLKYLQAKFQQNDLAKQSNKVRVRNAIDLTLLRNHQHSLPSLIKSLEKDGINTVLRQNNEGIIYGITYVDHRSQSVFNGSDLGKQYSAKSILERCNYTQKLQSGQSIQHQHLGQEQKEKVASNMEENNITGQHKALGIVEVLDDLMHPTQSNNYIPHQLKNIKKKKRQNISQTL